MRSGIVRALVCASVLGALLGAASAQTTVYSNAGSGDGFETSLSWGIRDDHWVGVSFLTGSATYNAPIFWMALRNVAGEGQRPEVRLTLRADDGAGMPGGIIAQDYIEIGATAAAFYAFDPLTATVPVLVTLTPNTRYHVTAEAPSEPVAQVAWHWNNSGATAGHRLSLDNATTWSAPGGNPEGALQVSATLVVPEPGTLALTALAGLCALRRRRSV